MAITASDNLNGTGNAALAGRVSSGPGAAVWVKEGGGNLQLDGTGTYARGASGYAVYSLGGTQAVADYEVQTKFRMPGAAFGDTFAITARLASANSFYAAVSNNGVWRIVLVTLANGAAGWTSLGSYTAALADNDVGLLRVQGTTLTFVLNTVQRIQVTDANLSGAGKGGVYWNAVTDDTGVGFDDFQINTLVVPTPANRKTSSNVGADGLWVPNQKETRIMVPE
jgi:hypothetical protein